MKFLNHYINILPPESSMTILEAENQ